MHVPLKADYAVRAAVELAHRGEPTKCRVIAHSQDVPLKFLVNILSDLRQARIVRSQRGADGGYWLIRPAGELTVAEVMEAVMGPLTTVGGELPENVAHNKDLWVVLGTNIRTVLGSVTIADLALSNAPVEDVPLRDLPVQDAAVQDMQVGDAR
jgi:Rrf2 family protein